MLLVLTGCVVRIEEPALVQKNPPPAIEQQEEKVPTSNNSSKKEDTTFSGAYQATVDMETKVEFTRARRTHVDTIRKGDYMMSKNNPKEALLYYLPALKALSGDIVLEKKVALAYVGLKNWSKAYEHFVRTPFLDMNPEHQSLLLLSLFFMEDAPDRHQELKKFPLSVADQEYFSVMASCFQGADICINAISTYSGTESRLGILQEALHSASKVSTEKFYTLFLLATRLYEQKMYRLSGMFASEILAANPHYQQVKKLRGFSLYELGKFAEARDLLLMALEQDPQDTEIIVRLGEVFSFLEEYSTANLYLNNAIMAGYTPKTLIERRLAYNYAKLGDIEGMKKVLGYLLQEKDVKEDDFSVAISLAIEQKEYTRAYSWAYEGMNLFPESKILLPLYLQALRLAGNTQEAQMIIKDLSADVRELPLVQLEQAVLLYQRNDLHEAKKIFLALEAFDADADFAQEASHYLRLIRVHEIVSQEGHETSQQEGRVFHGK